MASDRATEAPPKQVLDPDAPPVLFVGNEYVCPNCRAIIPTRKIVLMAKPPRFAHLLNDVIRCCYCNFIWSPDPMRTSIRPIEGQRGKVDGTVTSI